jgi:hypothetical protein
MTDDIERLKYIIDDRPLWGPECFLCKHHDSANCSKRRCAAFPDGIPTDILTGKVSHKKPYAGDNGIVFEEIK